MERSSLLLHMVMAAIAGAIGFLYIYPTIGQIRENQDTAVLFDREVAQVSGVNAQLSQKMNAINSISLSAKQRLFTYMPDTLDDVMFMRTMESILLTNQIQPSTLQFGSGASGNNGQNQSVATIDESGTLVASTEKTITSDLSVAFVTSEESLYSFFDAVEKSSVPFVLKEAVLAPSEGGTINAELVYTVHALATSTAASTLETGAMDMGMVDSGL